ncbi:hypothetical protein [Qipengyuania sp. MTN3-11]|uniref:hypothetical protein n=1 Tax=Qipengyuania sp. MTN3-11 TaxID=3056557 RepID=UPI0036F26A08
MIAEAVAEATILKVVQDHPELKTKQAEIPAPLKWAGGIIAALFTAGITGLGFWIVTTLSDVQVTVARMEERTALQDTSRDDRFTEIERRVNQLETYHRTGGAR